jgi:hypothetical protein
MIALIDYRTPWNDISEARYPRRKCRLYGERIRLLTAPREHCVGSRPAWVNQHRGGQPSANVSNRASPYLSSFVAPIPEIERNSSSDCGRTRASSRSVLS